MRELIDRIRFGDPLQGWEGDDRIELYCDAAERALRAVAARGRQRVPADAVASARGWPFDERIIARPDRVGRPAADQGAGR